MKIRILAEQDVQRLQLSAIPVIPEADLADRVDVTKVDLRIGRVVRILLFITADLCVVGFFFVAVSQQAGIAVGSTLPSLLTVAGRFAAALRSVATGGVPPPVCSVP